MFGVWPASINFGVCPAVLSLPLERVTSVHSRHRIATSGVYYAVVICGLSGCGETAQSRLDKAIPVRDRVVPVKGTVTVDGNPVGELTVRLVQAGEKAPSPTDPKALTKPDGKFYFTTYLDGDGVRPGNYVVLVEQLTRMGSSGWTGPDKLNNLYNHLAEPPATIEVVENKPINDLNLELKFAGIPPKKAPPYGATHAGKPLKKSGKNAARK